MKKREPGFSARLLRGTSVIMIVFGVLETLLFVALLAALLTMGSAAVKLFSGRREIVGAAFFLAAGLTEFAAGIFGGRLAKRGRGKPVCLILGLLCLAFTLASLILLGRELDLLNLATLVLCAVVPAVYLGCVLSRHPDPAPAPAEDPAPSPSPSED